MLLSMLRGRKMLACFLHYPSPFPIPPRFKEKCQFIKQQMEEWEREAGSEPQALSHTTPLGLWARSDLTVSFCPGLKLNGKQNHVGVLSQPVNPSPVTPYSDLGEGSSSTSIYLASF